MITTKGIEWANIVTEKNLLMEEIVELQERIYAYPEDPTTQEALREEVYQMVVDIKNMNEEIDRTREEIEVLTINYKNTVIKRTADIAILGSLITTGTTEEQLVAAMRDSIIPSANEKQKYNVKHLKGDIMPSKLIRIDE